MKLNASPQKIDELNDLPIKSENGAVTYVRDIAYVHDGHPPQTNIVRVDGRRAVLMTIQKTGSASTLDIVSSIKDKLPIIREILPDGASIAPTGDQSVFVEAAVKGVATEGIIAAALTALMILLFLGSWRSTLIITISISAVGDLVDHPAERARRNDQPDDARRSRARGRYSRRRRDRHHREHQPPSRRRRRASRTRFSKARDRFSCRPSCRRCRSVSCSMPMFLLAGVSRYLFVPMAEAVVFAMLTSYVLSRTLIPTLAKYWLRTHAEEQAAKANPNAWQRFQGRFEARFEAFRSHVSRNAGPGAAHGRSFIFIFLRRGGAVDAALPAAGS